MPDLAHLAAFALVALLMVITPGPNMAYLVSRSICEGPAAGLISLVGVATGFLVYMLAAAFGLTALFLAVPFAYDALRFAGALYLLWLAWKAVRPGGGSPFEEQALTPDPPLRLYAMGFTTSLLNPKVAVFYLSLLPQFVDPSRGDVLTQSLTLGLIQIATSVTVNALITVGAGGIARFLRDRPAWLRAQRWLMATVLGGLALRMATEARPR